jgi:hypothetical protein
MIEAPALHFYHIFSLSIASEIELPELRGIVPAEDGAPDVVIRRVAPPVIDDENRGYNVTPHGTLLSIEEAGRYLISDGRTILAERSPSGSERNLRLFLLGSALGALLHQRGLLPLHANGIEIEGRAVLFLGHSGAGKSTMAAWFHDRGFRILSDDVCVVTINGQGQPIAHPGIPRLRLWTEALRASGRAEEDFELAFDDSEKFNVPVAAKESTGPLPLDQIYLLGRAESEANVPVIERLQGVEAVDALVGNTYRGAYLPFIGGTQRHLMSCLHLVGRIPVFSARRRWGYEHFDQQASALEEHVRKHFSAGRG